MFFVFVWWEFKEVFLKNIYNWGLYLGKRREKSMNHLEHSALTLLIKDFFRVNVRRKHC